jgi:hypothetical protein
MAPIAFGFMILIGAAAVLGVVVGAIGGAVVWGIPPLSLAFLIASISARWLEARDPALTSPSPLHAGR